MRKINTELIVGLFLIAGFLVFAYISMQFGEFVWLTRGDHYTLKAEFQNVGGLKEGSVVSIAGVQVGRVDEITLTDDFRAMVSLYLPDKIRVTEDAIASIKTQGIIGDKYVRISQGGAMDYLEEGDLIFDTESAVDLEELVSKYVFGEI
ncbi:MAG: outer membrane lipid asymmetry maintenance protein MlaD [Desulfobia sp.]